MVTEDEQDQWAEHEQSTCCAANKHHYVMLVQPRGRSAQHTAITNQPGKHKWMTSKSSKPRYHTAGMHTLLVAHEDITYCQRHGQLCHSCSQKLHKEYLLEYISAPPHAHAADCRINPVFSLGDNHIATHVLYHWQNTPCKVGFFHQMS